MSATTLCRRIVVVQIHRCSLAPGHPVSFDLFGSESRTLYLGLDQCPLPCIRFDAPSSGQATIPTSLVRIARATELWQLGCASQNMRPNGAGSLSRGSVYRNVSRGLGNVHFIYEQVNTVRQTRLISDTTDAYFQSLATSACAGYAPIGCSLFLPCALARRGAVAVAFVHSHVVRRVWR